MWICFLIGGEISEKRRKVGEDYKEFGGEDWDSRKKHKKGKKLLRKNNEAEDDWGSLSSDGISGKLPRRVNKITLKVVHSAIFRMKDILMIIYYLYVF